MRHTAGEKYEIIRLVEDEDLPVRHTLRELQVHRSTFYAWYRRYAEPGQAGLAPKPSAERRYWNRIPPQGAPAGGGGRPGGPRPVAAGTGLAADRPGGPFSLGIERLSHPQGG